MVALPFTIFDVLKVCTLMSVNVNKSSIFPSYKLIMSFQKIKLLFLMDNLYETYVFMSFLMGENLLFSAVIYEYQNSYAV